MFILDIAHIFPTLYGYYAFGRMKGEITLYQ